TYSRFPYNYTLLTPLGGVPTPGAPGTTITEEQTPYTVSTDVDHDFGLFAQDKWTAGRATISLGLRYDHVHSSYPGTTLGPGDLTPNRNIVFPRTTQVSWSDVTPKSGIAYDLFGNGKTAVKVSLNKYLQG